MADERAGVEFPRALTSYPSDAGRSLADSLAARIQIEPFNAVATLIFLVAILHTFAAARFTRLAHRRQEKRDHEARRTGAPERPDVGAELLHYLGEVEVVFGLWAVVLFLMLGIHGGWGTADRYFNEVNYTEPLFVVVIMTLASTRPIIALAESALRRIANLAGGGVAAWWAAILTVGPLLGSFITEPGAMTICALLLARQFFSARPGPVLKYATLGLLFVNVSIGGMLTHFAAPPVLMVARPWGWDLLYVLTHIGWRAVIAIVASAGCYFLFFRTELRALSAASPDDPADRPGEGAHGRLLPIPVWLTLGHLAILAWTIVNAHSPALFIGGFLIFLGFAKATAEYQGTIELRAPLLVGFFLAGLVIHGGLQGWWIAPMLGRLGETALFTAATILTSFNDNAMITYLATLVPNLDDQLKLAVVEGAVTGGGLTVIANAPNPAGQALLSRFFDDAVSPLALAGGALVPTLVAALVFRLV